MLTILKLVVIVHSPRGSSAARAGGKEGKLGMGQPGPGRWESGAGVLKAQVHDNNSCRLVSTGLGQPLSHLAHVIWFSWDTTPLGVNVLVLILFGGSEKRNNVPIAAGSALSKAA